MAGLAAAGEDANAELHGESVGGCGTQYLCGTPPAVGGPGPEDAALAKGMLKTIDRAQGAQVTFSKLGKFTRAIWEVPGDKGAGYVRWNRILDEEGRTIRLFKDVYDQGANFLRRDPYVPRPPQ